MNGVKELVRNTGKRIAEKMEGRKRTVFIATGVLVAAALALSVLGSGSTRKQPSNVREEKDHKEEQSIVKLSAEAQKTAGITVRTAALEPLAAPIEATAAVELNGDRVAKVSARTSGRLVKNRIAIGMAVVALGLMLGCGTAARTIAARSISEQPDVFTEVTGGGAAPAGYADVSITASIKTHLEGYYKGESKASAHGKEAYPFLFNIDGQAVLWNGEGKKHELPRYDAHGRTSHDPEAGEGIKYVLNKKIRLRVGSHKLFFGLPEDEYYREVVINVKEGETQTLAFNPVYRYKKTPTRMPTYLQGVSYYAIVVNDKPVAQYAADALEGDSR